MPLWRKVHLLSVSGLGTPPDYAIPLKTIFLAYFIVTKFVLVFVNQASPVYHVHIGHGHIIVEVTVLKNTHILFHIGNRFIAVPACRLPFAYVRVMVSE